MAQVLVPPVVSGAQFVLAHAPGMLGSGSKPRRELAKGGAGLRRRMHGALRRFPDAVAYPPHQVMVGALSPEALAGIPRPWHTHPLADPRAEGPGGAIIDEATFYAWLARADVARVLRLADGFAPRIAHLLDGARVATAGPAEWSRAVAGGAEPFYAEADTPAGFVLPGHEEDEALAGSVLLENLAAKATGALALRRLLDAAGTAEPVEFLIGCGEEAVGDRYQRGGGNLAKAIGELAGVTGAGGIDVKAFCAAPIHALLVAGALVASGVYRRVAVVAGCSVAKLGMKMLGHLAAGYPILEDTLAGIAVDVAADDGRSPALRMDLAAVHRIRDGASPHQVLAALAPAALRPRDLRLSDVDRFAVELHNPDITEPAGSGNVPAQIYQVLAALAAADGEITRDEMPVFVRRHGMPGFAPTQGHIASAVPYLPHAIRALRDGELTRVQFIAKGSLFLGRMTAMGDGASIVLERRAR
jgi:hypothetical protein